MKSILCFGIYSLLISARTILVGKIFFIHLFPGFSWEIAHKLQTLAYYLGVPLVVLFLSSVFSKDTSKKIDKFIVIFASIFGLLVLLTPVRIFSLFNPVYQVFSFAVFIYVIYIAVVTCFRKRQGACLIGIALTTLVICAINDVLFLSVVVADSSDNFLRNFVTRGNLSSWGLLIFVFTQSMLLARKFSRSFTNLDMMLPGLDGMEVCQELRKKMSTPIIFLSCKSTPKDKTIGLIAGGDDYMSKPFDTMELIARVKAHLRRNRMLKNSNKKRTKGNLICYPALTIDLNSHSVTANGHNVILSPKEFQLLVLLAQNPNTVYSNEQLFESLWGVNSYGDYRTLMVHISNIRKKIELNPKNPTFIHTIKGAGYKFCLS